MKLRNSRWLLALVIVVSIAGGIWISYITYGSFNAYQEAVNTCQ